MKKFLICLSLLFSFCFIGSIKAATSYSTISNDNYNIDSLNFSFNGHTYNKTTLYEKINSALSNTNYTLSDFKYIFISIPSSPVASNSNFNGWIYIELFGIDFQPTQFRFSGTAYGGSYANIGSNTNLHLRISLNSSDISIHTLSPSTTLIEGMYGGVSNNYSRVYTNYPIELSMLRVGSYPDYVHFYLGNMGYNFTSINTQPFNVNFHLNGGTVMDFSNILDPNYIEEDYSITTNTLEFEDYLSSITPMKSNHTFMGWYYDSSFTNIFSPNDDLSSFGESSSNTTTYGENLFDKNNALRGYEIVNTDISSNPDWFVSNYIPVSPSTSYSNIGKDTGANILYYDSNYNYITKTNGGAQPVITIPSNSNIAFIRVNGQLSQIDTFEFREIITTNISVSNDLDLYAKWRYNPLITIHLNGGYIEDNFTNYKEINNIKDEMCELANCTQYNSWATNPYKELMTNIKNGRNTVSYFLSNYDSTMNTNDDQEFTNLANNLFNLYQTNGTKYVDDYSIRINYNEIDDYLSYVRDNIDKLGMVFRGFYYDSNFTRPRNNITEDTDLYVKWIYDNVDDFLSNTNFTTYTFNTNYDYAVITPQNHLDDVYLGINTLNRDITLNYYMTTYNSYTNESFSLEPLYSKNNMYYYLLNVYHINNTIEVLLLPKTVFENNNYEFLLTDNAYITYTNDLTEAIIYDDEGNEFETDISESYQTFQNNLINDETDLLMIFKNLINNKDNRVFSNINTIWNQFKKTKLYPYFMILIVGSLIILIIKSARRN